MALRQILVATNAAVRYHLLVKKNYDKLLNKLNK